MRRRTEDRFRALIDVTGDTVYRMSPDWSEVRGFEGPGFIADSRSAIVTWLDRYVHQDDHALMTAAIQQAIESKSPFEIEHRVRRMDGTFGWFLSRAVPLLDDEGRITEWIGAATDITERKRHEQGLGKLNAELERRVSERTAELRDLEERYRALVEASAQIVWTADSEGRFVEDSPSWRQFTGQSVEQWLGQGWLEAIHPDDREHAGHQWRAAVEQGDKVQARFRVRHAESGEWRLTWVRARPLHDADGSVRGWVGMNIDLPSESG